MEDVKTTNRIDKYFPNKHERKMLEKSLRNNYLVSYREDADLLMIRLIERMISSDLKMRPPIKEVKKINLFVSFAYGPNYDKRDHNSPDFAAFLCKIINKTNKTLIQHYENVSILILY